MNPRLATIIIFTLVALLANTSFKGGSAQQPQQIPRATKNTAVTMTANGRLVPIVRVVDGDTIVVVVDGVQEKVRLIGVNTPETVDPRRPVQCFGKEASDFTKDLLKGKDVRLESDPSQGDRDKYHRLLRYVFLSDETLVNKTIIEKGYGHEYTYHIPYRYQAEFKRAERIARETSQGLWAPGVCEQ